MLARLDCYMGGRVAEELIFRQSGVTAGASSDLLKATTLARKMVTKYGMSTEVGPVSHSYLDKRRSMSSETRLLIEKELHVLAKALLKNQTLTGRQIKNLLANVKSRKKWQSRVVKAQGSSQSNPAADEAEASDATDHVAAVSGATTNAAEAGPSTAAKAQGVDAVEGPEVHNDQQGLPPIQPS
ncbi:putative peptidase M41 [Medicago truncatula]|uniref:Putative peptidase M41 n=1 Tax=Medicago truncatula TaxID=3880 RepID=A0A396HW21_MEDTR|nr:putative peptidase M41 [Medicago truncatula]